MSDKVDAILVLDFGGQYCHLIARRVRECKVYSGIVPCDITPNEIKGLNERFNIKGLILSGGPSSVYQRDAPRINEEILDLGLPILGICYGHQLIVHIVHGKVETGSKGEYGITYAVIDKPVGVLKDLAPKEKVWMSHIDIVVELPEDYEVIAHTDISSIAGLQT